jgi:hypothetical protein
MREEREGDAVVDVFEFNLGEKRSGNGGGRSKGGR